MATCAAIIEQPTPTELVVVSITETRSAARCASPASQDGRDALTLAMPHFPSAAADSMNDLDPVVGRQPMAAKSAARDQLLVHLDSEAFAGEV